MISIIVPTYNEAGNIKKLIQEITKVLSDTNYFNKKSHFNALIPESFEIIIVDDNSPDGTWRIVKDLSKDKRYSSVKVIRRLNERGLSSAVIAGFKKAKGDIIGVIDADLSHPPQLMRKMIVECKKSDIVIASRYSGRGREQFSLFRRIVSKGATLMARPLTKVDDPMSGYFFFKKAVIKNADLKPKGYKILLEILVKGKYNKFKEVDFSFGKRYSGKSKLGARVYLDYIVHLFSLYSYKMRHK